MEKKILKLFLDRPKFYVAIFLMYLIFPSHLVNKISLNIFFYLKSSNALPMIFFHNKNMYIDLNTHVLKFLMKVRL